MKYLDAVVPKSTLGEEKKTSLFLLVSESPWQNYKMLYQSRVTLCTMGTFKKEQLCGTVEFKGSFSFSKQKDDDIEEGDLPEHKRPPAPIDFSKIDPGKPESILKLTKKGKTLMMFVTVSGNPTEKETEEITSLWQGSLFNANYDVQRWAVVNKDEVLAFTEPLLHFSRQSFQLFILGSSPPLLSVTISLFLYWFICQFVLITL